MLRFNLHQQCWLTEDAELRVGTDVLVPVGSRAAVAARVVVGDAPDDQVTADQQRVLLVPAQKEKYANHPKASKTSTFQYPISILMLSFFVMSKHFDTDQLWMSSSPFFHWMLGVGYPEAEHSSTTSDPSRAITLEGRWRN